MATQDLNSSGNITINGTTTKYYNANVYAGGTSHKALWYFGNLSVKYPSPRWTLTKATFTLVKRDTYTGSGTYTIGLASWNGANNASGALNSWSAHTTTVYADWDSSSYVEVDIKALMNIWLANPTSYTSIFITAGPFNGFTNVHSIAMEFSENNPTTPAVTLRGYVDASTENASYFNSQVNFTVGSTNADLLSFQYRIGAGAWTLLAYYDTSPYHFIRGETNAPNPSRGDKIQVRAVVSWLGSSSVYGAASNELTFINLPTPPTSCSLSPTVVVPGGTVTVTYSGGGSSALAATYGRVFKEGSATSQYSLSVSGGSWTFKSGNGTISFGRGDSFSADVYYADIFGNTSTAKSTSTFVTVNELPSAPNQTSAGGNTLRYANLTWDASTDPNDQSVTYQVYKKVGSETEAAIGSAQSARTYQDDLNSLAKGTVVQYRIRAKDSLGEWSGYSNAKSFTKVVAPTAPTMSASKVGSYFNTDFNFSWSGGADVTSIVVNCKNVTSEAVVNITPSGASAASGSGTHTPSGIDREKTVQVYATVSGPGGSATTNTVTLTKVKLPTAPTSVTITPAVVTPGGTVTVSFSGQSSPVTYSSTGFVRTTASSTWLHSATVSTGWTFKSGSGTVSFTRGATFYAGVRITDAFGNVSSGTLSGVITVNSVPTTPVNTSPGGYTIANATISWNASTDADSHAITYQMYKKVGTAAETAHGAETTSRSHTDSLTSLDRLTEVSYRIRAKDALGEWGSYSAAKTYTKELPPVAPTVAASKSGAYFNTDFNFSYSGGKYGTSVAVYCKIVETGSVVNITSSLASGATAASGSGSYTPAGVTRGKTVQVYAVITGNGGTATSNTVTLTKVVLPEAPTSPVWNRALNTPAETVRASVTAPSPVPTVNYAYTFYFYKGSGTSNIFNVGRSTNLYADVTNSNFTFERGSTYRFRCRINDTFGNEAWTGYSGNMTINSLPPAPTWTGSNPGWQHGAVSISWDSEADPDGGAVTYDIAKRIGTASWTYPVTGQAGKTYSDNIGTVAAGTVVYWQVRSRDSKGEVSAWTASRTATRNHVPTVPTLSFTNVKGTEIATTTVVTMSSSDSGGGSLTYQLDYSTDGTNFTRLDSSASATKSVTVSSYVAEGALIYFRGRSYDTMEYSAWSTVVSYTRNRTPTITSVTSDLAEYFSQNSASVSYTGAADADLSFVRLYLYKQDPSWVQVNTVDVTSSPHTYDLSIIPNNTPIQFYARAFDNFGLYSDSVTSHVRNKLGAPTTFSVVKSSFACYSGKAPILVKTTTVIIDLYVQIKVGNTTYDSANSSHSAWFSKTKMTSNDTLVIYPQTSLVGKTVTITGYYTADLKQAHSFTMTKANLSTVAAGDRTLTPFSNLANAINAVNSFYYSSSPIAAPRSGDIITTSFRNSITNAMTTLRNNLYSSSSFTIPSNPEFITADWFNSIVTLLTTYF